MAYIHVWPDRFARAWSGGQDRDTFASYPVAPLQQALQAHYNSDAHFCPAVLDGESLHPRLTVKTRDDVKSRVRFHVIVVDVDAPGKKASPEWLLEQKQALANTPWDSGIYYATKGGYRLLWILPVPLQIEQYLATLGALRLELEKYGVVCDPLVDWTRCYRLPYVVRDGRAQTGALEFPPNPIFPIHLLNVAAAANEDKPSIGALVTSAKTPITAGTVSEGGRNTTLLRMLGTLRNIAWMDEDSALQVAQVLNRNRFSPPLEEKEVETLVRNVWGRFEGGDIGAEDTSPDAKVKDRIELRQGFLDEQVKAVVNALSKHPDVFQRQNRIIRVLSDGQLEEFKTPGLRALSSEVAEFYKFKMTDAGPEAVRTDVPVDLINSVIEYGNYDGIRELHQVFTMPGLRSDGQLLTSSGYDAYTKALLRPTFEVDVPANPSYEEAIAARDRIAELYCDFPFEAPEHLAGAIASMMTPVLRLAIDGPTPMFLFESPTPSSGKSIMADLVAIVATGKGGSPMAPTNEEETTKQITAQLLMGTKIIWIDNIERPLGGPSLDAALTGDMWAARELGKTKMLILKNSATWLATGNNVRLAGDLARRVIRVYINPNMENPEERDPNAYRFPRIREHIKANRADIVRDILTMALARHQSGFVCPGTGMGSFEAWSYWVRETLLYVGMADCLDTQRVYKQGQGRSAMGTLLNCLFGVFNKTRSGSTTDTFTPKQLWDAVFEGVRFSGTADESNGLVAAYKEMTDDASLRAAANILSRWSNRVVDGLKIVKDDLDKVKGQQYRVVRVSKGANLTLVSEGQQ